MAISLERTPLRTAGGLRWIGRPLYHLFSFETVFALFLYSNRFKPLLPPLPIDDTVVFAALCIPIGAVIVLRNGIYLPGLAIVVASLAFLGWAALGLAWTPARRLAMGSLTYMATFNTLCLVCGAMVIAPSRERLVRFLAVILVLSLLIALGGIYIDIVYGSFRFFRGFGDWTRLYLSWGYAVTSGAVIAYCVALYARFGSLRQITAGALFGVMFYFLLVSSARGPLLSVALVCLVPLVVGSVEVGRGRLAVRHSTLVALALVIGGLGYVVYLIDSGQSVATLGRFAKLLEDSNNPDMMQGPNRFAYFAAAVRFWLMAPIVGNGVGSFSTMFIGMEIPGTHPHNIILEILTNHGIVGLVLFALFVGTAVRHATLARLGRDPLFMCIFLVFLSRFVAAMFNTEIAAQQPLMAFLAMLALRPPALDESDGLIEAETDPLAPDAGGDGRG